MTQATYASHLHESPEDLEVKRTAWRGTKERLMFLAKRFAEAHEPGSKGPSGKQQGIMDSAKDRENFPKGVIKKCGNLVRRIDAAEDPDKKSQLQLQLQAAQREFADRIGLGQAFA